MTLDLFADQAAPTGGGKPPALKRGTRVALISVPRPLVQEQGVIVNRHDINADVTPDTPGTLAGPDGWAYQVQLDNGDKRWVNDSQVMELDAPCRQVAA